MADRTIHLVFKTHLDIGFTDLAAKVRDLYHLQFIPQALATGEHFWREDPDRPMFVWTTGAWLIWDYLESAGAAEVARLERGVERGLIRWHGLPFTTHSELMSPALFRAGLSFSQELDRRFGMATTAAKMTDVPGHTLGVVPLMAEAGIRFLHIGVNTASPTPEVPDLFRWRAPGGEEVVVMYQRSYGETQFPDGFEDGLGFAHTEDNIGPQSVAQTVWAHRGLAHRHPGVAIRPGTLEDYAALVWPRREELPVVELELGDSWIHGAASDPVKLARFRALQRLYDAFEAEALDAPRRAFGRSLTLVAEHTWGVDIKTYLRDERAWDRADFEAARAADPRFAFTEASWREQRGYLEAAVAHLAEPDRTRAEGALAELVLDRVAPLAAEDAHLDLDGWRIELDPETGDLLVITNPEGVRLQGRSGSLVGFRHQSYDAVDVARHMDSYLAHRAEWAVLDHDKPGLAQARTARSTTFAPVFRGARRVGRRAVVLASMPSEACEALGAPASIEIAFAPAPAGLELTLCLRGKRANRMPEAGFLSLDPEGAAGWMFLKTGMWLPASRTARRGGGQLQAVFSVAADLPGGRRLDVTPVDTALAAPSQGDFMRFDPEPPDFSQGIRFVLYNNKWGTNFPMWWEGDLLARFEVSVTHRQ